MATIENIITGGEYDLIEVASNPAAGAGTASPLGSLAIVQDISGSTASLWQKTGAADTAWTQVANSATNSVAWALLGNAGTNVSTNFIGTTDAVSLAFRTNNVERARILPTGEVGIGTTSPTSLFSVGASSQFQVNSSGNIVRTNNVATSWPASQGTGGSVLTNDGSGQFSWNYAIVTINPRFSSYGLDDFTNTDSGSDVGQLSWNTSNGLPAVLPGEAGHPGIYRLAVLSSGSIVSIDLELQSILLSASQDIVMQTLVRIPALSSATQEFTFRWGLMSSVSGTGAPANACTIVYDRASSVNWRAVTTNASTSTTTSSAIAVSAGDWVYLEIFITANTSIVYKVNGTTIATHNTNIPTSTLGMAYKVAKTVGGSTTRNVDLDVFNYYMNLNR